MSEIKHSENRQLVARLSLSLDKNREEEAKSLEAKQEGLSRWVRFLKVVLHQPVLLKR